MTDTLTITRPDDWHLHVRDGEPLHTVVPHTAAQFARAIIMPNLRPPVTTAQQALDYKARIQAAVPAGVAFEPLMTLYLTDNLAPEEIARARAAGVVAAKLYPAGATTNSDAGVTSLKKIYPVLEAMQRAGMLLLVHGEVTSSDNDLFDREADFIDTFLDILRTTQTQTPQATATEAGDVLVLDPLWQRTPTWRGERINLPLTAQRILATLHQRCGEVVSYDDLFEVVKSGRNRDNVRKHVSTIREALREVDPGFEGIENVPMRGFRWVDSAPSPARRK